MTRTELLTVVGGSYLAWVLRQLKKLRPVRPVGFRHWCGRGNAHQLDCSVPFTQKALLHLRAGGASCEVCWKRCPLCGERLLTCSGRTFRISDRVFVGLSFLTVRQLLLTVTFLRRHGNRISPLAACDLEWLARADSSAFTGGDTFGR